jgi:quercetin dioxygenase-like cupin family protein
MIGDVQMGIVKQADLTPKIIGPGRTRYLAYGKDVMITVVDFKDGPCSEPDPPHAHPHEQVSYIETGDILFFLNGQPTHLGPGDIFIVPPHAPHNIQPLTKHVRIIDAFHPIREDFLE